METTTKFYRFVQDRISPMVRNYSKLEVIGLENLPPEGTGALLACNHSGSIWWDALCLIAGLEDRPINFVAHHWDAKVNAMRHILEQMGCGFLDEDLGDINENCSVVAGLDAGNLMCLYPEESYHSFRHRYTLFQFSPHVIKYAELSGAPIIPVTIIGAEEAAPTLFGPKLKSVPLHIPLHLPLILPFKVTIELGEPCFFDDLVSDYAANASKAENSGSLYEFGAEQLRQQIFTTMRQYKNCRLSEEKYIDKKALF